MSSDATQGPSPTEPHFAPPSTGLALLPGVALLYVGLWMVSGGGPLSLGWAAVSIGLALTLVGAIALGVSWGPAIVRSPH